MNKADLVLIDEQISNAIRLERFTAGERKKVIAVLDDLQKELHGKLATDLTDFGKARVKKLLKEATGIIDSTYKGIQGQLDIDGLARHEVTATVQSFAAIGLEAAIPTEAVLKALVHDTLLFGAPLKDWWQKQADDLAFRYANAVRQGVTQGETLQQVVVRVFGSKRLGTPGIGFPESVLRRNASALVHDSIMSVAGAARMETYKANEDIMKGYRWLSTLDGNICLACIARSGAEWDLEGKPTGGTKLPFAQAPIHVGCRCLLVPVLKSYKELGADIKEPPTGTRASDLGQIPADTSFDAFLKRHDKNYQDDLLGPGRADMWRAGKLSLSDLVGQNNRPWTLEQLRGARMPDMGSVIPGASYYNFKNPVIKEKINELLISENKRIMNKYPGINKYLTERPIQKIDISEAPSVSESSIRVKGKTKYMNTGGLYDDEKGRIILAGAKAGEDSILQLGNGKFRVDDSFIGTYRHEMGHAIGRASGADVMMGKIESDFKEAYQSYYFGLGQAQKEILTSEISVYAATNIRETFAEAVSAYIHPEYGLTKKLSGKLEAIFDKYLREVKE